jgi:hypothetical protein
VYSVIVRVFGAKSMIDHGCPRKTLLVGELLHPLQLMYPRVFLRDSGHVPRKPPSTPLSNCVKAAGSLPSALGEDPTLFKRSQTKLLYVYAKRSKVLRTNCQRSVRSGTPCISQSGFDFQDPDLEAPDLIHSVPRVVTQR